MESKRSGEHDDIRDGDSELQQQRASAPEKQLCLLLKLYQEEPLPSDYLPHVTGSQDFLGAWDPSKSAPMERRAMTVWDLSFVVSGDQDAIEFKYLLKSGLEKEPSILESGPNRVLNGGRMKRDATPIATFELPAFLGGGEHEERLEFRVTVEADAVSPFALAKSWRSQHKKNNFFSHSHGSTPSTGPQPLDVDLHRYQGPTSEFVSDPEGGVLQQRPHYEANATADPTGSTRSSSSSSSSLSPISRLGRLGLAGSKNRIVSVKDLVVLGEGGESTHPGTTDESAAGTDPFSPRFREDNGVYIDEGVGSSPGRRVKPETAAEQKVNGMAGDSRNEVDEEAQNMPQAAGAVAAAAVADRLLGPKERRQLAIVLVGLPARGKTFTAAKLTRYLRWLGHDTKHFNVGKYRRLNYGANQTADFFRGDNPEGVDKRNEIAVLAMEDMLAWMGEGGQVGVFDATNSTNERRNLLLKLAEGKCTVIFLETICTDPAVIDQNIRLKIQQSPDYAEISDYEAARADFKSRLENYERVYETVTQGSYIKMIDMVSDTSCQLQVSNISGYLPGRIVFFLVNCHLTARPILLTRHGESVDNVAGRIGGDTNLSEAGEKYALKLAEFVNERLKSERTASIWTSTLTRSISSARHISGFPKVQWRALDEINVGVCDGMTYAEIEERMREEHSGRSQDKLRYRYPRGESYLDVIQRLEPVIIELERQKSPVVVIAHQAVLRALYAYFADKPLKEVPHLQVPLHTIIEIQMGVTGVEEKRYKLM